MEISFKNWLEFQVHPFDPESDDYEIGNQADAVAKSSGINILSNKELTYVSKDEKGNVIGALYTSLDQNTFSFDVVVSQTAQGQGIGTKLVEEAISIYKHYKFDMPNLKIEADVVSPVMEHILKKKGWRVSKRIGGHALMRPNAI